MLPYLPPGRLRQINRLAIDIEKLKTLAAAVTAEANRLDALFQYLTRDRQRGVTRDALTALRKAGAPMGLRALTLTLMMECGQDTTDRKLVLRCMEKLRVSLTRQWQAGVVRRTPGPGRMIVWEVAR